MGREGFCFVDSVKSTVGSAELSRTLVVRLPFGNRYSAEKKDSTFFNQCTYSVVFIVCESSEPFGILKHTSWPQQLANRKVTGRVAKLI